VKINGGVVGRINPSSKTATSGIWNMHEVLVSKRANTWPTGLEVVSGLVAYYDAGNAASYPGSGNIWNDISGNGHHISLGSSVSYTSNFGGVLTFAKNSEGFGRNNSMNLSSSSNTVITFSRKTSNGDEGRVVTSLNNNWLLGHHDTTYGDYYAEGWVNDVSSPSSDTTWRMYTGTGNVSTDVWQLYINQSLVTSNSAGAQGPNGWNLNNQYSQFSNAQIGQLLAYNRVLSSTEISEVFNFFRSRYGI
jgi:hypothetical protein